MRPEVSEHFERSDCGVNIDSNDIIFFLGMVLTSIGLWLWSPALSLTAAGAIFMLFGYMRASPGGDKE